MNKVELPLFAAVFAISILAVSAFTTAAYGSLGINYSLMDSRLKPGQDSTVTLTFSNAAPGAAYSTKVSITPGNYVKPDKTYFELGSIGPGASQTTTLNIHIDESAISGSSYVIVDVKYNVEGIPVEQEAVVTIPVMIFREPILQLSDVSFNSTRIKPDDIIIMSFNISNKGMGGAKDVSISLGNSSTYTYIGSNELYMSILPASGLKPFSFLMRIGSDTKPGIYSIPIKLSYYFEDGKQNKSETKYANMEIFGDAKLDISNIKTEPTKISEDAFTSMIVKIENIGTGDAKSVRVGLDSPFLKNNVSLGKIASDEDASAVFSFNAGKSGEYPYTLTVEYENGAGKVATTSLEKLSVYGNGDGGMMYVVVAVMLAVVGFFAYTRMKK